MKNKRIEFNDVVLLILGLVLFYAFSDLASAQAKEVELNEVSIDYRNYFSNGYSPMLPITSRLNKGLDLTLNVDVVGFLYFDNKVNSLVDQNQFRLVGYNFRTGARPFSWLEVGYFHWSQHILDQVNPSNALFEKFAVEDAIEIKFILFRKDHRESIF